MPLFLTNLRRRSGMLGGGPGDGGVNIRCCCLFFGYKPGFVIYREVPLYPLRQGQTYRVSGVLVMLLSNVAC